MKAIFGFLMCLWLVFTVVAFTDYFQVEAAPELISAAQPWPVKYDCVAANDDPEAQRLCSELMQSLAGSGTVKFAFSPNRPYFHFIVVASNQDGYLALSASTAFAHPVLEGMELASFYSCYCISPGGLDTEGLVDHIAEKLILGTAEWFKWAHMRILRIGVEDKRFLQREAANV